MAKKVEEAQEELKAYEPVVVAYGSEDHESLLAGAYGMTRKEAEQIISERDENPLTHPYEVYRDAKAMLAALNAKPVPISKERGWKRDRTVASY